MKPVRAFTLLAFLLLVSGCVTGAEKLGAIRSGMTENQVLALLGRPFTATTSGPRRTLFYRLADLPFGRGRYDFPHEYAVVLVDGRVVETGRNGPVLRQSIDLRVHSY